MIFQLKRYARLFCVFVHCVHMEEEEAQNEEVFENFLGLDLAKSVGPGKNLAAVVKICSVRYIADRSGTIYVIFFYLVILYN